MTAVSAASSLAPCPRSSSAGLRRLAVMSRPVRTAHMPASPITPAATAIVPSVRARRANDGSPTARLICCRCLTSTSCSRCRPKSPRSPFTMGQSSMPSCSTPSPQRSRPSPPIRGTSAVRSGSWPSSHMGPGAHRSSPGGLCGWATALLRHARRAGSGPCLHGRDPAASSQELDRLCQAAVRLARASPRVSRPLYPPAMASSPMDAADPTRHHPATLVAMKLAPTAAAGETTKLLPRFDPTV